MKHKINPNPGFPLHRFNRAETLVWFRFPNMRPVLADRLSKVYPRTGVGVLSATLMLFLKVLPNGKHIELLPPFTKYEMWQVSNAPNAASECACRDFVDPEAGRWGDRDGALGHHPHCQFRRAAIDGFKIDHDNAVGRLENALGPDWQHKLKDGKVKPQARPDEWIRTMKELEG